MHWRLLEAKEAKGVVTGQRPVDPVGIPERVRAFRDLAAAPDDSVTLSQPGMAKTKSDEVRFCDFVLSGEYYFTVSQVIDFLPLTHRRQGASWGAFYTHIARSEGGNCRP